MSKIVFGYQGLDKQGVPARGTVEALDKQDALKKLRLLEDQGVHGITIEGVQQLNGSPSPASTEAAKRFCGHCGVENSTEHRFCAGCGKPLGETVQGPPAAQAATKRGRNNLKPWQRWVFLVCSLIIGWSAWSSFSTPGTKHSVKPSNAPAAKAGRYEIATTKDMSLKAVASLSSVSASELRHTPTNVRKVVRIVVAPGLSQAQYAATIEQAIRDLTAKDRDIDEIMLFVYDDASDVGGGYTVAKAEWAPNGKWGQGAVTPAIASSNNRRSYRTTIEWAARHRGQ